MIRPPPVAGRREVDRQHVKPAQEHGHRGGVFHGVGFPGATFVEREDRDRMRIELREELPRARRAGLRRGESTFPQVLNELDLERDLGRVGPVVSTQNKPLSPCVQQQVQIVQAAGEWSDVRILGLQREVGEAASELGARSVDLVTHVRSASGGWSFSG